MFSTFNFHFCPSVPTRRPSLIPAPYEHGHFHLLAALQLAVRSSALAFHIESDGDDDYFSGTNGASLRSQGKLCLTFALGSYPGSNEEKIRIANELEEYVDGAFLEEDYRQRIYRLGGVLAGQDQELWASLRERTVRVRDFAVGGLVEVS